MNERTQVVIVGGGYAGAMAAIRLAGRAGKRAEVTLVDPKGTLVQRLRLHQVAAGQEITQYPLAKLTGRRVRNVQAWASGIDLAAGRLEVSGPGGTHRLPYDRLILATGSTIATDGVPGVAEHAYTLADTDAALALNGALRTAKEGTVVAVVGGGMTGIEAATEIAEAWPQLTVRLISTSPSGDWLSPAGQEYLAGALHRLGIEVIDSVRVREVGERALQLTDGAAVPYGIAVWCGGFTGFGMGREAGLAVDGRDRVLVDEYLQSVSHPQVVAVGDAANLPRLGNGAAVRMTCQAGMPTAAHAADVIAAQLRGRTPERFDFGYIHQPISIGRKDALIQWVDRADTPKSRVLTGRWGARYKNIVCASAVLGLAWERRMPGVLRWPGAGVEAGAVAEDPVQV